MADNLVEQFNLGNHLVGYTSMKIAMSRLKGSFDETPPHQLELLKCRPFFRTTAARHIDLSHRNVLGSSKGSIKRGCLTVFCLTPHPLPVQFGKTYQELPPTDIALSGFT